MPYYDPYVVYGPWWWPAYRPVFWRPWHARPVFFGHPQFVVRHVDWHGRQVVRHPDGHRHPRAIQHVQTPFRDQRAPLRTQESHRALPHPAPIRQLPHPVVGNPVSIPSHSGSSVRPIVDSVRIHAQAASQAQPQPRREPPRFEQRRSEPRFEQRASEQRREHRPPPQQQRQHGQSNKQHSNRRG